MIEEYNNIKNPKELLDFMNKNIKYGFKYNNKIYYGNEDVFFKKWKLNNVKDILINGYANCFEQTEIERDWFSNNNYEYKTYFIIFLLDYENSYACHTYLAYKENNKWYHFENADESNKGIHEYKDLNSLIMSQKKKLIEYNKNQGLKINKEIIDKIHIFEYNKPKNNLNFNEFIDNILDNGKDIIGE